MSSFVLELKFNPIKLAPLLMRLHLFLASGVAPSSLFLKSRALTPGHTIWCDTILWDCGHGCLVSFASVIHEHSPQYLIASFEYIQMYAVHYCNKKTLRTNLEPYFQLLQLFFSRYIAFLFTVIGTTVFFASSFLPCSFYCFFHIIFNLLDIN